MSIRYQLLDYMYTAVYRQNQTGLPTLNPLFFNYPEDANTYPIDLQLFLGDEPVFKVKDPNKPKRFGRNKGARPAVTTAAPPPPAGPATPA